MQQEQQTTMVLIPQKAWESLTNDMKEIKEFVRERETRENAEWLESAEARKMLGISPKTWQTYRDKRIIPFAQFGRKIMVKRSDIETFLESHFITADKKEYKKKYRASSKMLNERNEYNELLSKLYAADNESA